MMPSLSPRQCLGQHGARFLLAARREDIDDLHFALELESVVLDSSLQNERRLSPLGIVHEARFAAGGKSSHEIHWKLCALDRGTRAAELVGVVAQFAGNCSPTSADACLADSCLLTPRRFLVAHLFEQHVLTVHLLKLTAQSYSHATHIA